jgi:ubiquinone/menaquinone biosynthesis C-methylase UbiE
MRAPRLDAVRQPDDVCLSVHEVAASGFGAQAEAYERARPSYPADAVAWVVDALRVPEGGRACDVAAGTGKFTRLLVDALPGVDVVAAEPVEGMRSVFTSSSPGVAVVGAVAEALPFADASLDGLTVAQAFHWFDASRALEEFHRVLRPRSRLVIVWNTRDVSEPWVDHVWSVVQRLETRAPWQANAWRDASSAVSESPLFDALHEATFHHGQRLTPDEVVDRIRSVSHVAALPAARQAAVLDEVRAVLRDDPATAGRAHVILPYRVDVFWTGRT